MVENRMQIRLVSLEKIIITFLSSKSHSSVIIIKQANSIKKSDGYHGKIDIISIKEID
jgi:hypothetical protein